MAARRGLYLNHPYVSIFLEQHPIRVTEHAKFGRCVLASRNIKAGEVVLIEKPFLSSNPEQCHPVVKQFLSLPGLEKLPRTRKMFGLLVGSLANARFSNKFPINPLDLSPMDLLRSTQSNILETDTAYLKKIGLVKVLGQIFEIEEPYWNDQVFDELFSRIKTNQYQDDLYGMASLFNHSCYNNCVWDFRPPFSEDNPNRETIIALDDIKEGAQLFMCYTKDQEMLNEGYGIPCKLNLEAPETGLSCLCATERPDQDFVAKYHNLVRCSQSILEKSI